jgi:hypothetical protein
MERLRPSSISQAPVPLTLNFKDDRRCNGLVAIKKTSIIAVTFVKGIEFRRVPCAGRG